MANFTWPINPSTSGPVQFIKDGNTETVTQDTSTPANSVPLPVISLDSTGAEVDLATEAKQDSIIQELQDIETDVENINTTLATTNSTLSNIDTSINNIEAVDFATEAKQDTQITELQSINSELDTQSTSLSSIDTSLNNIEADIDALNARLGGSLVPEEYDYVQLQYVTVGNGIGEIETVTYKLGGSGGATVATLTLAYDVQNRLTSVTKA